MLYIITYEGRHSVEYERMLFLFCFEHNKTGSGRDIKNVSKVYL